MDHLSPEDAKRQIDDGATLIDIRSQKEFADAHIPGAVLLPAALIDADCAPQIKNGQVVFYCASGARSAQGVMTLRRLGYTEVHNLGGLSHWQAAGGAIQR